MNLMQRLKHLFEKITLLWEKNCLKTIHKKNRKWSTSMAHLGRIYHKILGS